MSPGSFETGDEPGGGIIIGGGTVGGEAGDCEARLGLIASAGLPKDGSRFIG